MVRERTRLLRDCVRMNAPIPLRPRLRFADGVVLTPQHKRTKTTTRVRSLTDDAGLCWLFKWRQSLTIQRVRFFLLTVNGSAP